MSPWAERGLTLLVAFAGLGLALLVGLPLPALFGPMLACLVAALLGAPLRGLSPATTAARTVLGVAVGFLGLVPMVGATLGAAVVCAVAAFDEPRKALIAAIYLDGGLEAATDFLRRELDEDLVSGATQTIVGHDYKSALQERLQALGRTLPEYRVASASGPDHRKIFTIEVLIGGEVVASASGTAKKQAEQEAARQALSQLS